MKMPKNPVKSPQERSKAPSEDLINFKMGKTNTAPSKAIRRGNTRGR